MFWNSPDFSKWYFNLYKNWFKFERTVKILPVDFQKPWWQVVWDQKVGFFIRVFSEIAQEVYLALIPLVFGFIFLNQNYNYLWWFVIGYISLELFNRWTVKVYSVLVIQSMFSIVFASYNYFLTIDPIYHVSKSTGGIVSKIQGASSDLADLLLNFVGDVVPPLAGYITVTIVLFSSNWKLGLIAFTGFIIITFINGFISFISSLTFKPIVSKVTDESNSVLVENLYQNALIRSSFATIEQVKKTRNQIKNVMVVRLLSWNGTGINMTITRFIYIVCVLLVGLVSIEMIKSGEASPSAVLVLLITFINGSNGILTLGRTIRGITETHSRVNDLFEFIRGFGKQTFPVLENEKLTMKNEQ